MTLPWQHGHYQGARATAARVRRFAKVTGLKPSRAYAMVFGRPFTESGTYPQGADHTNVWLQGDRYIVTTEPYGTRDLGALEEWCASHGWAYRKAPGLGMWNPPHTVLYLLSPPKCGGDIDAVLGP